MILLRNQKIHRNTPALAIPWYFFLLILRWGYINFMKIPPFVQAWRLRGTCNPFDRPSVFNLLDVLAVLLLRSLYRVVFFFLVSLVILWQKWNLKSSEIFFPLLATVNFYKCFRDFLHTVAFFSITLSQMFLFNFWRIFALNIARDNCRFRFLTSTPSYISY